MVNELSDPEVFDAVRVLAKHGLGAVRVHMHDESGAIVPLQVGLVQLERD